MYKVVERYWYTASDYCDCDVAEFESELAAKQFAAVKNLNCYNGHFYVTACKKSNVVRWLSNLCI